MQSLLNPWLVKSEKYAARFESKSFEAHILAYEQSCNAHPWAVIGTQLPPIWQKKGLELQRNRRSQYSRHRPARLQLPLAQYPWRHGLAQWLCAISEMCPLNRWLGPKIWIRQLHRRASITFQHPAFLQRHAVETWHVQAISMVTSDSIWSYS